MRLSITVAFALTSMAHSCALARPLKSAHDSRPDVAVTQSHWVANTLSLNLTRALTSIQPLSSQVTPLSIGQSVRLGPYAIRTCTRSWPQSR
ncbi:hypothetical protein K474DRAFT_1662464 [Panus rudis PR-1116 ss-1]|nr:hypothetical protein K474DRAFT_1662464 [Panus rudis PR-1116 ss-1]